MIQNPYRLVVSFAALIASLALGAEWGSAQSPTPSKPDAAKAGALAGVVRDTLGQVVVGAEVFVDGLTNKAISDDSGRFHIDGIPAGKNGFLIRKLGLSPVSFETSIVEDKTLVLAIKMQPAEQQLDPVVVSGKAELPGLARTGFYERQRQHLGYYISPAKIDSASHLLSAAELLRNIPGIEVRCAALTLCNVYSRTPPYCLSVFVDGRQEEGNLNDVVSIDQVAAFEIYRSPSTVPHEFQTRLNMKTAPGRGIKSFTGTAGCGALVVWTKGKA